MPFEFFESMSSAQKRAMLNNRCVVINMAFQGGHNHLHDELEVKVKPQRMQVVEVHDKTPEDLVAEVREQIGKLKTPKPPVYVFGFHKDLITHLLRLHKEGINVTGVIMSPKQIEHFNTKIEGEQITPARLAEVMSMEFQSKKPKTRFDKQL